MIILKDGIKMRKDLVLKGYTITELSKKIGCSKSTISGILTEVRNPSPRIAIKICGELGKQFDDYFFIEGVHKTKQKEV